MKKIFREFLHKDEIGFTNLDESTLVVFDTNTLLNIYRYSNSTQNKFINSVKKIKDNIWIPYHVGLEFNLNRKDAIYRLKDNEKETLKSMRKNIKDFRTSMKETLFSTSTLRSSDTTKFKNKILKYIDDELDKLDIKLAKKNEELYDFIRPEKDLADEIATLFDGRTGHSYSKKELEDVLKDADIRYENEIPPGYKDKDKSTIYYNDLEINKSYGDLIVWHQILDKARNDSIKRVVFVTDDVKEDWWYIIKGERVGPRAELKNEMLRESEADFFMIDSNTFLSKMLGESTPLIDKIDIKSNKDINFKDAIRIIDELNSENSIFFRDKFTPKNHRGKIRTERRKYYRNLESLENSNDNSTNEEYFHIKMLLRNFEKGRERLIDSLINNSNLEKSTDELLSEITHLDSEIAFLKRRLETLE